MQGGDTKAKHSIEFKGRKVALRYPAISKQGEILIPINDLAKALGTALTVRTGTRTIVLRGQDTILAYVLGSKVATVNGVKRILDVGPEVAKGTLFVPVGKLAADLGIEIVEEGLGNGESGVVETDSAAPMTDSAAPITERADTDGDEEVTEDGARDSEGEDQETVAGTAGEIEEIEDRDGDDPGKDRDETEAETGKDTRDEIKADVETGDRTEDETAADEAPSVSELTDLKPGTLILVDPESVSGAAATPGPAGLNANRVTAAVSRSLVAALNDVGLPAALTRTNDKYLAVVERAALARESEARAFINIRVNSFPDPTTSGAETLHKAECDASHGLAKVVQGALVDDMERLDRGAKPGSLLLLSEVPVPTIVAKLGYITNPEEEELLGDAAFQEEVGRAMAEAIAAFFDD